MKKILLALNLFLASLSHAEVVIEEQPVVILGSGVAALTSAIYLARAGIPPVVITGPSMGGTITQSHNVQNWPGEISISGIDLSEKVKKQAELNGAILQSEVVVAVDFSARPFTITTKKILGGTEELKKYKTQSCIIALGAKPNLLGVPGEQGYWSRGVYSCAVCDGSLYKDKVVAVVGGGDSALIESQYLANIASEVHVLVRGDAFRTVEMERMKEVLSTPNIKVHFNTVVKEVKGDAEKATGLLIEKTNAKTASFMPVDALFLAIGSQPNTEMFRGQLELDSKGYIVLKNHQMTSVEGVYAVGDVSDPEFERAVERILSTVTDEQKQQIEKKIERLASTAKGKFALLDYHNFKGDGVPESERYRGQGWGLKQVLENMPENQDPLLAFVESAQILLKLRVKNSPSERKEERWLSGWLTRVDGYLRPLNN